jgi:hypothetical protein
LAPALCLSLLAGRLISLRLTSLGFLSARSGGERLTAENMDRLVDETTPMMRFTMRSSPAPGRPAVDVASGL